MESDQCAPAIIRERVHGIYKEDFSPCLKSPTEERMRLLDAQLDESLIPKDVCVSTMSITGRLSIGEIDLLSITESIVLSDEGIRSIEYRHIFRSIPSAKPKKSRKRKESNFYNSLSLDVSVGDDGGRSMHLKLFKNGSIQGAGCRSVQHGNYSLQQLLKSLTSILEDHSLRFSDLQINLINSNFRVNFQINQEQLVRICKAEKITCAFEKSKHAGVCIRFIASCGGKPVSLFVFESGAVVITGARKGIQVAESYEFIFNLLHSNRSTIARLSSASMLQSALKNPKFAHLIQLPQK